MKFRVYYEDTDAQGIVYHANYINFCERARSEAFITNKVEFYGENSHFVVTHIDASYKKPAKFGDILEIKNSLLEIKKASAKIKQEIYRSEDINGEKSCDLVFVAIVTFAYMRDMKPAKMPESALNFLKSFSV